MTTVGELFVGLGVKGAEKSVGAITGVKDGLGKTKEMALETKAAIIGAIFAFERMFAGAMNTGASLDKFNTLTGESSQQLERYQGAARNVNVANESVTNSFLKLQGIMSDVLYTGQGPAGLNIIMAEMGLGPESIKKFMDAPDQFIQQLQSWTQKHKKDPALVRKILGGIGLDNDFITSLQKNAYTPAALAAAPVHSKSDVDSLSKSRAMMANMGANFEMSMDHITAKHLPELLKQLKPVVAQLTKVIEGFATMAEKIQLLKGAGLVFEGWAKIFENMSQVIDYLNEMAEQNAKGPSSSGYPVKTSAGVVHSVEEARAEATKKGLDPNKVSIEYEKAWQENQERVSKKRAEREKQSAVEFGHNAREGMMNFFTKLMGGAPVAGSDVPAPAPATVGALPPPPPKVAPVHTSSTTTKQMNFHQTNNIHGAAPEVGHAIASVSQKAVKDTFANMTSRSQGA